MKRDLVLTIICMHIKIILEEAIIRRIDPTIAMHKAIERGGESIVTKFNHTNLFNY